jgi:acetyltransferase-like isoleucine patch superfamily enzyme
MESVPQPPPPPPHKPHLDKQPMSATVPSVPKTEKAKMLAGEHYLEYDPELTDDRKRCKDACWRFNNSDNPGHEVSKEERERMLVQILKPKTLHTVTNSEGVQRTLIGSMGKNCVVEAPFFAEYGYNLVLGNNVGIGRNCSIFDTGEVIIGNNTVIGPNVQIYASSRPIETVKRANTYGPQRTARVVIGPHCWIGAGSMISSGVTIGKGTVILAGSVVSKVNILNESGLVKYKLTPQLDRI